MNTYLKVMLATNPLHGFRAVDTFPWLLLFTPKSLSIRYSAVPLAVLCGILLVSAILLMDNIPSTAKLCVFFVFTFFFLLSKRQQLGISPNFLLLILILLVIEDLLITYMDILSPFVRDARGALFIFREKSYAALFIGFMLSFLSESDRGRTSIAILLGIFLSLESALGWVIFAIFIYHRFFRGNKYMPSAGVATFIGIITGYIGIYVLGNTSISALISASDALRFLINLESLHIVHVGSFYLHDSAGYYPTVLDINKGFMKDWLNMSPQAPFFLMAFFFGKYGVAISTLFFIAYFLALPRNSSSSRGFLHAMIVINVLLQGFLLSPYLFGYLFIHPYSVKST